MPRTSVSKRVRGLPGTGPWVSGLGGRDRGIAREPEYGPRFPGRYVAACAE
ncbi:hypothetical protein TNCT6_08280 [Streptomyces sp. 6-11-2]|nr:hypothetical protein TNCT6_08280 [Streptomyces sp. 6-11-2]